MRSAFFGFHVASTGLFTARANLNVTSHNISNAEIPGFSRQVAQARANNPLNLRDGRGLYGTGSQITGINQIRDRFLDMKFWGQRAVHGRYTAVNQHLNFVETVFNQLPDAGVLRTFNDFFRGMQDLTVRAQDSINRTNVITTSMGLADIIQHNAQALQRQQRDINREVADVVTIINSLGSQIASLNEQIHIFERDGSNANDLRDQRALLIDELSQYVNVTVEERDFSVPGIPNDRRTSVLINGQDFVHHDRVSRLELVPRTEPQRRNAMDVPGLYDIRFAGTRNEFNIYSPTLGGKLRGLIDLRDGNNTEITETGVVQWPRGFDVLNPERWAGGFVGGGTAAAFNPSLPSTWPIGYSYPLEGETTRFKGIPFYMNQLNHLVRTFARAINEGRNSDLGQMNDTIGHIHGFNGEDPPRNLNTKFFTFEGAPEDSLALRQWLVPGPNGTIITVPEEGAPLVDPSRLLPPADVLRDAEGAPLFTLDYSQMTALNFIVNPALVSDPTLLAASSNNMAGEANNDVIFGFNNVGTDNSLFREGRLVAFIIAISNHLAVDNQQAESFRLSYEEITMQTHNHRLSISGVDINEEMMNLVRFQTMFTAASRIVNVLDTVYDTLINRLGNV